jgi:GcrA cell cycle regulator
VHRLGLSGRSGPSRPRLKSARRLAPRVPAIGQGNPAFRALLANPALPAPAEEIVIPLAERKTVATLTPRCCRWPIGDPKQPDFHFCGRERHADLPYCEIHACRAFQPARSRPVLPPPHATPLMLPAPAAASTLLHAAALLTQL